MLFRSWSNAPGGSGRSAVLMPPAAPQGSYAAPEQQATAMQQTLSGHTMKLASENRDFMSRLNVATGAVAPAVPAPVIQGDRMNVAGIDPNNPGNVEPEDAAVRFYALFGMKIPDEYGQRLGFV